MGVSAGRRGLTGVNVDSSLTHFPKIIIGGGGVFAGRGE